MDNFEGGTPMTNSGVTQTATIQPQMVSMPRSEEIVLSQESETTIMRPDSATRVEERKDTKSVADRLLNDTKDIGIGEVFKKLSMGGYRSEVDDKTQSNEVDFEDSTLILDPQSESDAGPEELSEDSGKTFNAQKREAIAYVSEQVTADPLMKQMIGEVASEMIARGEEIDPEALQEEALSRYIENKEQGEPMSLDKKVEEIEKQFPELLEENDDFRKELKEFKELVKVQSATMQTMALALLEMAKKLHAEKEDEEEKASLLQLMILLMGFLLQEMMSSKDKNNQSESEEPKIDLNIDLSKLALFSSKKEQQEKPDQIAA